MTEIEKLVELERAATPGPWYAAGGYVSPRHPDSPGFSRSIYHLDELGQETPQAPYQAVRFSNWKDAAFIAAARTAVPELIARAEKAERERDAAVAALKPFADAADHMEKCRDERPLWIALNTGWSQREHVPLTVGHLRQARAALASNSGGGA